jgi:hypothetical protein
VMLTTVALYVTSSVTAWLLFSKNAAIGRGKPMIRTRPAKTDYER